jgi:hypothetical protein
MKHNIEIISFTAKIDEDANRGFTVVIDGISMRGIVKLIEPFNKPSYYRFYFPSGPAISKHQDYKDIRRQLLLEMITRSETMLPKSQAIK